MLDLNTILLGTNDTKRLGEFYQKVFKEKPNFQEKDFYAFKVGSAWLAIIKHSEVKGKSKNPERVMINFETTDIKGEFDRIKKIKGVKVIAEPYEMDDGSNAWVATFADVDGNYFQLNTPFE